MHYWGDANVDWEGINDAAAFIGEGLRRWGRMNVTQYKEKFGTVRVYCSFGVTCLWQLVRPGWIYYKGPKALQRVGMNYWPFLRLLNYLVVPYHAWLYKRYYRLARKRWPHLEEEIYRGADYCELLGAKVKPFKEYPDEGGGMIWWPEWDDEPE